MKKLLYLEEISKIFPYVFKLSFFGVLFSVLAFVLSVDSLDNAAIMVSVLVIDLLSLFFTIVTAKKFSIEKAKFMDLFVRNESFNTSVVSRYYTVIIGTLSGTVFAIANLVLSKKFSSLLILFFLAAASYLSGTVMFGVFWGLNRVISFKEKGLVL